MNSQGISVYVYLGIFQSLSMSYRVLKFGLGWLVEAVRKSVILALT